jgi:hypothetical protein
VTRVRGVVVAGTFAIAVTGAHALYRSWPAAHGTEILVRAALVRQPSLAGVVRVAVPFDRIALDVPHTSPAVTESFEPVRPIGAWWIRDGDPRANARARRGRLLYLQLTAGQPVSPGGPAVMRPVTVSDVVVPGAINVAGTVTQVREDGYVWLEYPFGWVPVPSTVEARARPERGRDHHDGEVTPPATDSGVFAVLRVLPSGRAALVGVVVDGTRY